MSKFVEQAIVLSSQNKKSEVKLITAEGCESKSCPLSNLCGKQDIIVEAENLINAKQGDRVKIKIESSQFYKALFLVFILPIILLLTGYFLGIRVAILLNWGRESTGYVFMGFGIIIWFFVLRFSSKFYKTKYEIIEALEEN